MAAPRITGKEYAGALRDMRTLRDQIDAAEKRNEELEAALRDCLEIAGSDCEHELCKAIIQRASPLMREE